MNRNKKGISAIVATVLIILITVAAVTIIWAAIIPMINNQLSKGTLCLDAVSQVSLSDSGYTCIDEFGGPSGLGLISLQIRHGALDFDLADVQIIVTAGGNSYSYLLSNETGGIVIAPKDSNGNIIFPGANEEKVYAIDIGPTGPVYIQDDIDSVEIAPIVRVGNTEEVCEISASRVLRNC